MDTSSSLASPPPADDAQAQDRFDRARILRAFNASLALIAVLVAVFASQGLFDWRPWSVGPQQASGLLGVLTAPLLHGSLEHLAGNAGALLILGTLAGSVYPRATLAALPLLWLGSGLGAWLLGDPGSHHLGASGVTHGLLFLVFALGLLRHRDPLPPRKRYSWEDEDEETLSALDEELEPPPPAQVPVLWQPPQVPRGVVLRFPPRQERDGG